jgi:hypothetical protein
VPVRPDAALALAAAKWRGVDAAAVRAARRRRARRRRARELLQRVHGARAHEAQNGGRRDASRRPKAAQALSQSFRAGGAHPTRAAPASARHGRRRLPHALRGAAVRGLRKPRRAHADASARACANNSLACVCARREDASGAASPRWAFLENAGGSRVPDCVADATAAYMRDSYVQARAHTRLLVSRQPSLARLH